MEESQDVGSSSAPPTEQAAAEPADTPQLQLPEEAPVEPADAQHPPEEEPESHEPSFRRTLSLLASPIVDESGSARSVFFGLLSLSLIGTSIGLVMPKNPALPTHWYRYVSAAIGYVYFLCWSVSFYPQVISNFKRKSTQGLSADFCGLNVLGFACYGTYNLCFFFSPTIQRLYRERYGQDAEITVQSNDVAFAIHAFLLSSVTFVQIGYYGGFRAQRPSLLILAFMLVAGLMCVCYPFMVLAYPVAFNWLDYLYLLSYVKIAISLIKYIPQVILNYQRKSTVGWSIWNIILDFSGGALSDLQLILDCADLKDFSLITGNLAKFGLGSISICFDIVFMLQHYVLYVESEESSPEPESEPLLTNEERESPEEPQATGV
jgi:cystinosin